ncbi:MAG: DUF3488 and transglutaminase-like domain-containing protein [Gammaproteobacteria bacterium]|nr:DUF3488 and transglutaminase-like domain-containing protein [Gammaproteobacteria bacterium]MBU1654029.1 DUF3488 and transglutaminase-like domain-containing protein [Gammaproteobacteria bacterium]MBU1959698.1 DUF3488 and transglutaminase-like domain-containing protein [Gammaproteobacteria bacterium]
MSANPRKIPLLDPLQRPLQRYQELRFLVFFGMAASPHLFILDEVFSWTFFALLIYRVIAVFHSRLLPSRPLLLVLTLAFLILFFFRVERILGAQGGISLLLVMAGLKLLEIRRRRDLYFSVLLGFFTVITVFLHEDSPPVALLMLAAVIGMISILVESSRIAGPACRLFDLRQAAILSLQALPIALVLFLLFPRLNAPLWSFNLGEKTARTGLSDSITPGSISQLVLSSEVAFRVLFDGPIPPPRERYWRGPVLWRTDGLNWTRSPQMMAPAQEVPMGLRVADYRIFLQPSENPWLILLDLPASAPDGSVLSRDFQVLTQTPVSALRRYQARSFTSFSPLGIDPMQQRLGLQLPSNVTPRMRALVAGWRSGAASPAQIVQKALVHFNQQPFVYSLRPPLLGNSPIDEFLFETRRGFCEHYATSFTLLMRLAGIPSRLVTGYQGGELNPQGDYLLVRQSDAHAWSEVWLPDRGWVRVDPTGAVAPERIERPLDIDAALGEGESALFVIEGSGLFRAFGRNIRWGLDALNLSWQRWIIGYDQSRQRDFLSHMGLGWVDQRLLSALAFGLAGIVFLILFAYLRRQGRERPDPLAKAYGRFCRRLAGIGISREGHEGPLDFERRVLSKRPDLAPEVAPIIGSYVGLAYGRSSPEGIDRLVKRIDAFWPRRRS